MKSRWIYAGLLLFFWMALAEKIDFSTIAVGVVVVFWVLKNTSFQMHLEMRRLRSIGLWIVFFLELLMAVVIANIQVARIVLSRCLIISPQVVKHTSKLKNTSLLVVYANAITLTPGTMTVDIDKNTLWIHCLGDRYVQGLENNPLEKRLLAIEEAYHE